MEIESKNLKWKACFHGLALLHHLNISIQTMRLDFSNHEDAFVRGIIEFAPRFLTSWNFTFQVVFLIMALTSDLVEIMQFQGKRVISWTAALKYWRDLLFSSLVFSFTMFVACMFWSLYLINRELVFPQSYDQVMSWTYNLSLHAWILVVPAFETLAEQGRRGDRRQELAVLWIVQGAYAVVYYTTYYTTGRWLYQVFDVMSPPCIVLYQIFIWLSIHSFYELRWHFLCTEIEKNSAKILRTDFVESHDVNKNVLKNFSKYG